MYIGSTCMYVCVCTTYVCIYVLHFDLFTCSALNDSSQTSLDGKKLDEKYHFPGVLGEWEARFVAVGVLWLHHVIVVHMEGYSLMGLIVTLFS